LQILLLHKAREHGEYLTTVRLFSSRLLATFCGTHTHTRAHCLFAAYEKWFSNPYSPRVLRALSNYA